MTDAPQYKTQSTKRVRSSRPRTALLFFANFLFLSVIALGQTTQPTPDSWNSLIDQVGSALATEEQNEALSKLIPDEAIIQQFDSTQTETRFRVAEKLSHMSVLWQHGYISAPPTLVSDLSNSLGDNADVPMTLKRQLIPKDSAAVVKADATAQRWITRVLSSDSSSLISVILFWDRQPENASSPGLREPIFVLIRGQMTGDAPVIRQIRYGQMSQALN